MRHNAQGDLKKGHINFVSRPHNPRRGFGANRGMIGIIGPRIDPTSGPAVFDRGLVSYRGGGLTVCESYPMLHPGQS